MERERDGEALVCAGEIAAVLPPAAGGPGAGHGRRRRTTRISISERRGSPRRPHSRRPCSRPQRARASTPLRIATPGCHPATRRPGSRASWRAGHHGDMEWMERDAGPPRRPARALAAGAQRRHARHELRARRRPPRRRWRSATARRSPSMPARATITTSLKGKLKQVAGRLARLAAGREVKVFVDTAPVMEKPLAAAAGLGWQGKHSVLVSREHGSWLFLGAIFTTAELPPDAPAPDHCGSCRALPRRLPDGRVPGALPARCAALHLLSHHRAQGPDPARAAGRASAIASSAATTALPSARGTSSPQPAREAKLRARDDLGALPAGRTRAASTTRRFRALLRRHAGQAHRARPLRPQRHGRYRQFRRRRASLPHAERLLRRSLRPGPRRGRVGALAPAARRRDLRELAALHRWAVKPTPTSSPNGRAPNLEPAHLRLWLHRRRPSCGRERRRFTRHRRARSGRRRRPPRSAHDGVAGGVRPGGGRGDRPAASIRSPRLDRAAGRAAGLHPAGRRGRSRAARASGTRIAAAAAPALDRLSLDGGRLWRPRGRWVDETTPPRPVSERSGAPRRRPRQAGSPSAAAVRQGRAGLPAVRHLRPWPERARQPRRRHGAAASSSPARCSTASMSTTSPARWPPRWSGRAGGDLQRHRRRARARRRTWWPTRRACSASQPPPEIAFETAQLSPMARSFYGENKRVANRRRARGARLRLPLSDLSRGHCSAGRRRRGAAGLASGRVAGGVRAEMLDVAGVDALTGRITQHVGGAELPVHHRAFPEAAPTRR